MERESLLAVLIVLFGGLAFQLFAKWPGRINAQSGSRPSERLQYLAVWWPAAPALTVAAWLCGWALSQPDPVPARVGFLLFVAAMPFAIVGARALLRALWSLCRSPRRYGIATIGLLRPRVVVAPELEATLDPRALQAALAHERTHVRHYDPLRIWLAQFVTDLQWPSASARTRLMRWLASLELSRDDEARVGGVEGADLAAAVLGSLRYQMGLTTAVATLIGQPEALSARIARLLLPLPSTATGEEPQYHIMAGGLAAIWAFAIALGLLCGEPLIGALLDLSY